MSRPIIEQRNRAPQSAGYQRQRSAPGLDVAAPIVSNAPETNTFAELGRALGVAAGIVATESNTKQSRLEAEYRQDQEEISLASAEADTWGNQIDPTKLAEDRVYARRVSALQGTRTALELSEKKATDFKEWRRENPLAPESKAREWLGEWDGIHLADDEGNVREAAAARAEREATEAGKLDEEYANLVSSPNSVNQGEAERIFGAKFDRMTDGQSRIAVVEQAVRTRGVIPSTYKNYLNRVPTSLDGFKTWRGSMSHMRALNEQVYASLGEQSRAAYEAWEAIRQTGRYTDEQLFVRIQSQDSKRGRELVGSKRGGEIVTEITDGVTTPLAISKARSLVQTFGSFQDMPEEEALRLAKASYAATYFMHDGMMYHKSYAHSAGRIEKTKEEVAVALRSRGINVDADNLVIAPIMDGSQFIVRERGSHRSLTNPLSADVIFRASQNRREQNLRANYGEAPLGAARQGLDPTRIIPGETSTERTRRIQMEQQAARDKR